MKEDNILKILESGGKSLEELKSELNLNRINLEERELKKGLRDLVRKGDIEKDGNIYRLKVKKVENKKNYIPFVLLALIVILGFYLRIYHIDYPVIGYHNWKETHYITEARNFAREGFFAKGFFVPMWDYPSLYSDPSGAHADTFPTISIIVALLFMLFGPVLWIARLVGILFNIGAVVMTYFFVKKLFNREDLALTSALIAAIIPVFVFFSHNVDLVNPGIFFMVTSAYSYLKWRESFHRRDLILTSFFFALAALTKYFFAIIAIPIFLTFPLKKFLKRENIGLILISLLILIPIPAWIYYSQNIIAEKYEKGAGVSVGLLTSGISQFQKQGWWDTQNSYLSDNYTFIALFFAFIGLIFIFFSYYKNRKFEDKFMVSYFIASVVYVIISASKLAGHSYYYYPITPFIAILIAYAIIGISNFVGRMNVEGKKIKYINFLAIIILLIIISSSMPESTSRQFNTQFIGLDVAGNYIKEHSDRNEKIMFPSHQSYGVLWHADRRGYATPETVKEIKDAEERNVTWIFVYQWGFSILQNEEGWSYIKQNYSLKQFAFLRTDKGIEPIYLLLKKGGTFNENEINSMIQNKKISYRDYEYTKGIQRMYYVNIEE